MAKEIKRPNPESDFAQSNVAVFGDQLAEFCVQLCQAYRRHLEQENPENLPVLNLFCEMFTAAASNLRNELMVVYQELDAPTQNLLNRHVENSGILKMQSGAIEICRTAFFTKSKLELILEIIKKIIAELLKLIEDYFVLPQWLETVLAIIVDLMEILDNVLQLILELLGLDSLFLRQAESNLLETHPKWIKFKKAILD